VKFDILSLFDLGLITQLDRMRQIFVVLCALVGKTTPPFGHPSKGGEFFSARKNRHGLKIPLLRRGGHLADPHLFAAHNLTPRI